MQTYSHLFIAAILRKPLSRRFHLQTNKGVPEFRGSAFLFGAVLPDLPLIITTLVCMVIDKLNGLSVPDPDTVINGSVTMRLFRDWYFNNPWVIAEHNLFHSPTSLIIMLGITWWLYSKGKQRYTPWCFWLLISCALHTSCDILVHHDDGPLLFFPFNWDIRYFSPLSYWDPSYYGKQFVIFEHLLDLILIAILLRQFSHWRIARKKHSRTH